MMLEAIWGSIKQTCVHLDLTPQDYLKSYCISPTKQVWKQACLK